MAKEPAKIPAKPQEQKPTTDAASRLAQQSGNTGDGDGPKQPVSQDDPRRTAVGATRPANQAETSDVARGRAPDSEGSVDTPPPEEQTEAASSDKPHGTAAGSEEAEDPEIRRAPPLESGGGDFRLINRQSDPVRVRFERQREGGRWESAGTFSLAQDDMTGIMVDEGVRVILDRV